MWKIDRKWPNNVANIKNVKIALEIVLCLYVTTSTFHLFYYILNLEFFRLIFHPLDKSIKSSQSMQKV